MRTPAENEQFVREHWDLRIFTMHYGHDGLYGVPLDGHYDSRSPSPELAWAAAADFTEQRMEEIRQVEAEIDAVIYWLDNEVYKATPKRILAREQAALESLKKGWIA